MKTTTAAIVFLLVLNFFYLASGQNLFDRMDVDSYLRNRKVVEYHIKCVVYNGPCDKTGNEMKQRLIPLIANECSGCTSDQRIKLGKIVQYLQRQYPKVWQDMQSKFRHA